MNKELIEQYFRYRQRVAALQYALGLLSWDNATFSASIAGASIRNEHYGFLSEESFNIVTSDSYIDVVNKLYELREELALPLRRSVELSFKEIKLLKNIPADEYRQFAILAQESQNIWEKAKEESDFASYAPYLEKVLAYRVKFAHYQGLINNSVYDTMLDQYEEGLTTAMLDDFFQLLKSEIVPLFNKIKRSSLYKVNYLKKMNQMTYDIEKQQLLSDKVMDLIGFDKSRGQLKTSVHPFSLGLSINDVRMTTRYDKHQLLSSLYSVIHESGHSIYTQNCDPELVQYALADGVSMAFHESQSRFYENIIGRSPEFAKQLYKIIKKLFPEQFKDFSLSEFILAVNRVENSKIRTEADELTYPLHVLVRYEIEKKLVSGALTIDKLPEEWNRLMKDYLGVEIKNDREGVLQDVHWCDGAFGYFPTYALGSAYGAQMLERMKQDLDIESALEKDIAPLTAWLKEHVHKFGALLPPAKLLIDATGENFNPMYFIDYLKAKYHRIYKLQ